MQITSIKNYTFYNNKQTFKGWERSVLPTMTYAGIKFPISNIPMYRNNTWAFRDNKEIPKIMSGVVNLFRDIDHANTKIYGCSNGAESLSMYMFLSARYSNDVLSKFTPFEAMDIDEYAISVAKSGILPIDYEEFIKIQIYTGNKFNEFFNGAEHGVPDKPLNIFESHPQIEKIFKGRHYVENDGGFETGRRFVFNKKHLKNIHYSVGDIVKDCEYIEPVRTFLSTRYMLPYLYDKDILKIFKVLGKRLPSKSCIALGDYDFIPYIDRAYEFDLKAVLKDNGFSNKGTGSEFLFVKS